MPWLARVKGVVQLWYPGAAAGTGIASVLFGDAEPGGRLPISFPADESQGVRPYRGGGTVKYEEGVDVGYRYLAQDGQQPLFPFGYGLSYTTWPCRSFTRFISAFDGRSVSAPVEAVKLLINIERRSHEILPRWPFVTRCSPRAL